MTAPPRTIRVLSTQRFDDAWLAAAASAAPNLEVVQHSADRVDDLPPELLATAEVMYTGSCYPDRRQAPNLRWVQLDTSGCDHLAGTDLWDNDAVTITTIGGVSPKPIAGYAMLMVLAFAHRLPAAVEHQRRREWPTFAERWERFMPARLEGSTMVVVGYGRLGRAVGEAARAFGIRVLGVRREPGSDEQDVLGVDRLHEALAQADHVVLTVPLTDQTRNLIDERAFRALKPGAVLVNVARGGVVDEPALLAALADGRLAGVASDVFAEEPLPADSPLWDDPRVLVTPHVAGFAPDYFEAVGSLFRANLAAYASGRPLANVVDRGRGY